MVVWLAVFSCGLCVGLCMYSEFYSALCFVAFLVYRVLSLPPFPPGSVCLFFFWGGRGGGWGWG